MVERRIEASGVGSSSLPLPTTGPEACGKQIIRYSIESKVLNIYKEVAIECISSSLPKQGRRSYEALGLAPYLHIIWGPK